MTAMTCPFCKTLANFQDVWAAPYKPPFLAAVTRHIGETAAMACPNPKCRMVVMVVRSGDYVVQHWPVRVGGKAFPDVPDQVAATADEAHQCLSIGAHRGAVALARAVVEATAKERGVVNGNLMGKIDALATAGTISDAMKDAAHEIRFAGNEVAHGDLAEEVLSQEDAEEVVSLMDAILLRVYQEPAQVARVREKREARRALP